MANPWDIDWSKGPPPAADAAVAPWDHDWSKGAPPAPVSTGQDMANAGAAGVVKGAIGLAGSGKDIPDLIDMLANAGNKKLVDMGFPGAVPRNAPKLFDNPLPGSADITPKVEEALGGKLYEAQTTPGKFAAKVGEFLPGALAGPVNGVRGLVGNVARNAVAPGLASEGAGELAQKYAPGWEGTARVVAGLAAPAITPRMLTPLPHAGPAASAASHADHVELLRREGVPINAGDVTDRPGLSYLENTVSPGRNKAQSEAFTAAATRRAGAETPVLIHGAGGTVDNLLTEVGGRFDRLQAGNTLRVDPALQNGVNAVHADYTRVPGLYNDETVNAITGAGHRIADVSRANGGAIPGEEYQALRSDLSRAARSSTNPDRAEGLHALVEHLDDAMGRSMPPGGQAEWDRARRDYRNALVIERAATAAGAGVSQGSITPANLLSSAKAVYGKRATERGHDDFSDLAHAGNAVIKNLADSGTSQRVRINEMISNSAKRAGAGVGYATGASTGMAEGGVGGLLLGHDALSPIIEMAMRQGVRGAVMNPATQAWLRNQAAAGAPGALSTPQGLFTALQSLRQ